MFHLNEGILDRGIRLVLGLVLVGFLFTVLTGVWQIIAAVVAAILLLTSIVGFCPLYGLFGINTRRAEKRELHPAP
jgi:hypothetical protein